MLTPVHGLQHPEGSQHGTCHPSQSPSSVLSLIHHSSNSNRPPHPQTSQTPSLSCMVWPDVSQKDLRWGRAPLAPCLPPATIMSCIYVSFLLSLLPCQANTPGLGSVPHTLNCYLSTHTNLLSCFPSLINIFPGSSYCHLGQLTAKLLEKVTSTHWLLHLPNYSPTQQPDPSFT